MGHSRCFVRGLAGNRIWASPPNGQQHMSRLCDATMVGAPGGLGGWPWEAMTSARARWLRLRRRHYADPRDAFLFSPWGPREGVPQKRRFLQKTVPEDGGIHSSTSSTLGMSHAFQRVHPEGGGVNTSGRLQVPIAVSGSVCFTIGGSERSLRAQTVDLTIHLTMLVPRH